MAAFRLRTGIDASHLSILYEGLEHGDPITPEVVTAWSEAGGQDAYPVLGDPSGKDILEALMFFGGVVPTQCVLTPRMEMISCWAGHEGDPEGYSILEAHALAAQQ